MVDDLKAERIDYPIKERFFSWPILFAFLVSIIIVCFSCYFAFREIQKNNEQAQQLNERNFKKLNIASGDFDDKQISKLIPILQNYTADFCDSRSKYKLITKVDEAGFIRLAAKLSADQYEKCAKELNFLALSSDYYEELGEHSKALEIINRAIELGPASANYRFERAKIYEAMGNFEKALLDQISTLDLLGRGEEIGGQQFYEVAKMYASLKRFCEAATPLETYISYKYAERSSDPQIIRLINEYRSKGNCKQSAKKDSTIVAAKDSGGVYLVQAKLNNVTGIFVLDPGASMVAVTKSFANKARISTNAEDKVSLQTANGMTEGLLATANSVQVGNAYSTSVPVVVQDDATLGNSDNVVGLLGMSFLSRFIVEIGKDKDSVELRNRF